MTAFNFRYSKDQAEGMGSRVRQDVLDMVELMILVE